VDYTKILKFVKFEISIYTIQQESMKV